MANASRTTAVPVAVTYVVSRTIVRSTYRRVTELAFGARSNQCPADSPSSRPKIDGLSKRGKHNQSIEPSRLTSAALCRSESNA